MPATAAPPAAGLPLFFNTIVGVDPKLHGKLRPDRDAGFGFAAGAQFVPLGFEEIKAAAHDYPILFTATAEPIAIALLGLQQGSNLFVQADGSWKPDTYIPAYVRAFPFVCLSSGSSNELYLGMEPDAPCLSRETGEPLFDGQKPSKVLNEAIALTAAVRNNLVMTEQFARTLDQAGLLEQEEAKIEFTNGGSAIVRGFKVLKRDRFEKVNDETYLDWRRRKWIPAIYAHLYSASRWMRLMQAAAPSHPRTTTH